MDLSYKDFNTLLGNVTLIYDMLSWQLPSEIPTLNRVAELNAKNLKLLGSYLDDDSVPTTQLELFPEDKEDGDDYQ